MSANRSVSVAGWCKVLVPIYLRTKHLDRFDRCRWRGKSPVFLYQERLRRLRNAGNFSSFASFAATARSINIALLERNASITRNSYARRMCEISPTFKRYPTRYLNIMAEQVFYQMRHFSSNRRIFLPFFHVYSRKIWKIMEKLRVRNYWSIKSFDINVLIFCTFFKY